MLLNPYISPGRLRPPLTIDPEPDPAVWTRPLPKEPGDWPDRNVKYVRWADTKEVLGTVEQAAEKLGLTVRQVQQRCWRGRHERYEGGRQRAMEYVEVGE